VFKNIISKLSFPIIILLSGFLNIYNIWKLGYGNEYYAAAIKSMLSSFSNFFFVSFDSTGFITVDKAPLSLWLDTMFAKIFGFNGLVILLPHALAGIGVTALVYFIVKKITGNIPALIASLMIDISPVNVAVYRNNTPDALLLVLILLTVLFLMKYFETFKSKFLILSAVMLGLGFNTKMLQAYLILPSIITTSFIFLPGNILGRIKPVLLFIIVTAIVSFSWITIVDLVPTTIRPYVGGSTNNSEWNLAFNYNGAQRLLGENGIGNNPGFNVGDKGLLRLFKGEMGTQTGWFLGSVILFIVYFIFNYFKTIIKIVLGNLTKNSNYIKFTLFSIIFFITEYLFFSFASFFHSYYLNIFAIPIVFIMGSFIYEIVACPLNDKLFIIPFASIPVQAYLISQSTYASWLIPIILALSTISLILIFKTNNIIKIYSSAFLIISLFITPFIWSGYTTFIGNTATAIFIGGPSVGNDFNRMGVPGARNLPPAQLTSISSGLQNSTPSGSALSKGLFDNRGTNENVVNYLRQNNNGEKYYVAVSSASDAEGFILNQNIGNVMTLGGFSGRDQAITLSELKKVINNNEIRFFYLNERDNRNNGSISLNDDGSINDRRNSGGGGVFNANEEITSWVKQNCRAVEGILRLYDCKNNNL
jgi:4-amino-4-deoxy-L-arabinose transferase-like glycosyltransferase